MRILFTGASSFSGYWFVRELSAAGHEVWATFRRAAVDYTDVRRERVALLTSVCRPIHGCSFGDPAFLDLVRQQGPWDLLCHHAADATNYKSPDFDVHAALAGNARNLPAVLAALASRGCRRVVLTGSVFEAGEGAGSNGLPAFSPYGLSKSLTSEVFRFYAARHGLRLGKFVIPNPFGPYEEPRFTTYLIRSWLAGRTPAVNTPAYVRDNIHVSLLARAYARFAEGLSGRAGFERLGPSQYAETQGAFAQRFAAALAPRLGVPCHLDLQEQREFPEPRARINTDALDPVSLAWDEARAWDELAAYYRAALAS
jgi:nucleoside-diphosphate-sugar epimerase